MIRYLCSLILINSLNNVFCVRTLQVYTKRGLIIGFTDDGVQNKYYGIPYARVNESNPFGNSLDYPTFRDYFIASDPSIKCPQVSANNDNITLQCLTLNILTPYDIKDPYLPVFVWFYGGTYLTGYAGGFGGKYLVNNDIIVVTVNYRLGAYGFLCLDDPTVPGNQGLKDQLTALRWVKENIQSFGGDPEKITIGGNSYGGASVDYHFYSNNEKLFDKAILQSGSMLTDGAFVVPDYSAAIKLAKYLGHNTNDTRNALKYLADASPAQVVTATANLGLTLRPCKEKSFKNVQRFLTTDPLHVENSVKVQKTPILIGYNSMEAVALLIQQNETYFEKHANIIQEYVQRYFVLEKCDLDFLTETIQAYYLGGKPPSVGNVLNISDYISDIRLNHPAEVTVNNFIKFHADKVYKYLFSYIGSSPYKNVPGIGAYHMEELKFIFETSAVLSTDEQRKLREQMSLMWANFVKYGDPTPEVTELLPTKWTPITNYTIRPYLNIDVPISLKNNVFQERMAFWDLIWHYYKRYSIFL